MCAGLGVPSIVPSNGPMSRRPFPFGGVSWGEFPRVLGTVRRSDFLPPIPASSLPRSPVPPAPCLRSLLGRAPPCSARRFIDPDSPNWVLLRRWQDLPGSWGTPMHTCPALRPRWNPEVWPLQLPDAAFRHLESVGFHICLFRGSITRPACSLSTLRSRGHPRTTQDSVPAAGQLCRGRLVTPWAPTQGFSLVTSPPPRPSFAWRT